MFWADLTPFSRKDVFVVGPILGSLLLGLVLRTLRRWERQEARREAFTDADSDFDPDADAGGKGHLSGGEVAGLLARCGEPGLAEMGLHEEAQEAVHELELGWGGTVDWGEFEDWFWRQPSSKRQLLYDDLVPRSGPAGACKRPSRFPMQIGFLWCFCMGAQGA